MNFCQKANNTTSVLIFFQENESEIALFFYFTTVLKDLNLSPSFEESKETVISLLAVSCLTVLSNIHTLLAEIHKRNTTGTISSQPFRYFKDVDESFFHHLKNDLAYINQQLVKDLIDLDSIYTIDNNSTMPVFGE